MSIKQTLKNLCPPILWHVLKLIMPPIIMNTARNSVLKRRENAAKQKEARFVREIEQDKNIASTLQDGLLRIRITNKCNAKCRYCGIQFWTPEVQKMSMDPKILYDYCKPLYEQIKILLLTGGDPLIAKESMHYCRFISENYPQITMYLETNGIAFTDEWQYLAMKNLMKVHISLNASNEEVFAKGCQEGEAGQRAYRKVKDNIHAYMALLREHNLEAFAPDISMVINKDTYSDVRDFVRYTLIENLHHCMFFFDYTESDMSLDYFGTPDTSRQALYELMKLERVLAGKYFVYFRLWIPLKETEMMQGQIEAIPIEELRKEYTDILKLAENRSMKTEFEKRQEIRKKNGKKEFIFDEDWTPTIRQTNISGQDICFAPFKLLDIYPDNKFECCSWIIPRFQLHDFVKNDKIDWNEAYNTLAMKKLRCDMLHDDFNLCQKCCPLNPTYTEICSSHKYGYCRGEE